ncbi:sensor histidine kinase [Flavobacterium agrisoli]|uniref:Sensor histidine kinase n=1 Tax=Flavobacterium agrisoli TaxID=2793066 RepID=A0A934PP09_9FLAO|nr:sensor histidine kinase [Flavobacterium agrisoli]MBK0370279.1 sensor histidine kinase [Flavobacterium agrisoli]
MEAFKNKNRQKIIIHTTIWIFFIFSSWVQFFGTIFSVNTDFYVQWATGIVLFYLNYFYLVPRFLLQKKYGWYLGWTIGLIVVFMSFRIAYTKPKFQHENRMAIEKFDPKNKPNEIPKGFPPPDFNKEPHKEPFFFKIAPSIYYILIIAISSVIKILAEYYDNEQKKLIAESHRTTTELNFLRQQTNPHFLFNSLNSIYSLAFKKSDLVPNAIVTLSELLRYMLYETDNKTVALEKEINYIQNYIELQKLRLNNIENININVHGDAKNKFIEPLLLISFVENAFKYGTDYKGAAYIKIKITIEGNNLVFKIENKIEDYTTDPENSGIGLNNIKNRLDLIYPNAHDLKIQQDNQFYKVYLLLQLDKIKTHLN